MCLLLAVIVLYISQTGSTEYTSNHNTEIGFLGLAVWFKRLFIVISSITISKPKPWEQRWLYQFEGWLIIKHRTITILSDSYPIQTLFFRPRVNVGNVKNEDFCFFFVLFFKRIHKNIFLLFIFCIPSMKGGNLLNVYTR